MWIVDYVRNLDACHQNLLTHICSPKSFQTLSQTKLFRSLLHEKLKVTLKSTINTRYVSKLFSRFLNIFLLYYLIERKLHHFKTVQYESQIQPTALKLN